MKQLRALMVKDCEIRIFVYKKFKANLYFKKYQLQSWPSEVLTINVFVVFDIKCTSMNISVKLSAAIYLNF